MTIVQGTSVAREFCQTIFRARVIRADLSVRRAWAFLGAKRDELELSKLANLDGLASE